MPARRVTGVLDAPATIVANTTGFRCVNVDDSPVIGIADAIKILGAVGGANIPGNPAWNYQMDVDASGGISIADVMREQGAVGLAHCSSLDRYTYDGNGALLKRTHFPDGGTPTVAKPAATTSTVYIGGIYEQTLSGMTPGVSTPTGSTNYYSLYGRTIAMRQTPVGGPMTF